MDFCGLRIGDTPLYQMPELAAGIKGRPILWVKDESVNSTGTFKVRYLPSRLEQYEHVDGPVTFLDITLGNLGEAGGVVCKAYGRQRQFASVVPKSIDRRTKRKLKKYGPVISLDLERYRTNSELLQEAERRLGRKAGTIVPIDGIDSNGTGYQTLARELFEQGVRGDHYVVVSVGGANLLFSLVKYYENLVKEGLLDRMPRFIAATKPQNKAFGSGAMEEPACGEKLAAHFSRIGPQAHEIIDRYNIPVIEVPDADNIAEVQHLKEKRVRAGSNAAVAFAAVRKYAEETGFDGSSEVVVINTGYDEPISPRSRNWTRYAAGLLAASSLFPISGHNNFRISKETAELTMENRREQILKEYNLYDIKAFADYIGGSEAEKEELITRLRMHMNMWSSDWRIAEAGEKGNPELKRLREDFYSFTRVKKASGANRTDDNVLQAQYDIRRLLRARFGLPETEHEFKLDDVGGSFITHYLEMDPSLNDKIAFAMARTVGKINSEFVKTVADLYYPGVGNIESLTCLDDPKCVQIFRDFGKWKQGQMRNRDESIRKHAESVEAYEAISNKR